MFCTQCGTKNLDSAKFCVQCGKALGAAASEPAAPAAAPAPDPADQTTVVYNAATMGMAPPPPPPAGSSEPTIVASASSLAAEPAAATQVRRPPGVGEPPAKKGLSTGMVLMIVGAVLVVLLGVAAAIGLPIYKEQMLRTKIAADIATSRTVTKAVENFFAANQQPPESQSDLPPIPKGNVSRISYVREGEKVGVFLDFNVDGRTGTVMWGPYLEEGKISWECHNLSFDDKLLPTECQGSGKKN